MGSQSRVASASCWVFTVRGVQSKVAQEKEKQDKKKQEQEKAKEPKTISFTISAAGDCTLGTY